MIEAIKRWAVWILGAVAIAVPVVGYFFGKKKGREEMPAGPVINPVARAKAEREEQAAELRAREEHEDIADVFRDLRKEPRDLKTEIAAAMKRDREKR